MCDVCDVVHNACSGGELDVEGVALVVILALPGAV